MRSTDRLLTWPTRNCPLENQWVESSPADRLDALLRRVSLLSVDA